MARQQFDQCFLFLVGHQAAQRILERRHQPAGARAVLQDRVFQGVQIDAHARMRSDFDGMQAVAFQRLQRGIEGGGLHDHGIAGAGHRRQAQVQRVQRAVRDDDLVHGHGQPVGQVAQRDGAPQRRVAGAQVIDGPPRIQLLHRRRHEACQPAVRQQGRTGKRRAKWQHVAAQRGVQHAQHVVADVHRMAARSGAGHAVQFGQRGARRALHVIARPVTRADEAARFQQVVGLEHGGRTDAAAGAGLPH